MSGTVARKLATSSVNLAGTSKAASSAAGLPSASAALSRSTRTSNVPRMPVRLAVTPVRVCEVLGAVAPAVELVRPKARSALSAPMPIVSASLPSLKVVPTRLTARLVSVSGPIAVGAAVWAASCSVESTVNEENEVPAMSASSVTPPQPVAFDVCATSHQVATESPPTLRAPTISTSTVPLAQIWASDTPGFGVT